MPKSNSQQCCRSLNIDDQPLSPTVIIEQIEQLRSTHRTFINYIIGICVLGGVVTYRTVSLGYDTDSFELLKMGLYTGLFLGVFTGLMIDGNATRKIKMIAVSLIVSISVGLFSSMLVTLMLGGLVNWISSLNILGGALGCMWVLTKYDVVLKELEAMAFVNKSQFVFIKKAGSQFDEINAFNEKIAKEDRIPIIGEYWAIEQWVMSKNA